MQLSWLIGKPCKGQKGSSGKEFVGLKNKGGKKKEK